MEKMPPVSLLDKYVGEELLPLYTTTVVVTGGVSGHGRASGQATAEDGGLDVPLRMPPALGGNGGGTNPEQLFAAGYAACFHGALKLIAVKKGLKLPADVAVRCSVTIARDPEDGEFCLTSDLRVALPGVPEAQALELVNDTMMTCPYSKLAKQGMASTVQIC